MARLEHFPEAYIEFLAHFHGDRDYFECHEGLEAYWKEHPDSPYREQWVGLIQAAVGMYHYRRGNAAGAAKSLAGALRRSDPAHLRALGIEADRWLDRLRTALHGVRTGGPFRDIDVPLADRELEAACRQWCEARGMSWGEPSRMDAPDLVHRHTLRDRSDVIAARQSALRRRGDQSP